MSDEAEGGEAVREAQAGVARLLAASRAAASDRRGSKLDALDMSPAQWGAVTEDGPLGAALLLEGLTPGTYDVERVKAFAAAIRSRTAKVKAGDVSGLEADLVSQLAFLNGLIAFAVRRGAADGVSPAAADVFLRLALKAQGAFTRTAAVLVTIALRPVNEP